jgi:hypothetical protein
MNGISPFMTSMLIVWAVITTVFVALMIYRSLISMKEDDQLFLDPAESKIEEEQRQIITKVIRITPYTKGFGFASLGLLVLIGVMWVYQGMKASGLMP